MAIYAGVQSHLGIAVACWMDWRENFYELAYLLHGYTKTVKWY